jgi:hypothetical protein
MLNSLIIGINLMMPPDVMKLYRLDENEVLKIDWVSWQLIMAKLVK